MIKVEFFGNFRLAFGVSEIMIEAVNVKELFKVIALKFNQMDISEIESATLFINDKALQGVFRKRTRLNDGDRILFMYPSCGG